MLIYLRNNIVVYTLLFFILMKQESVAQHIDSPLSYSTKSLIIPSLLTTTGILLNSNSPNSIKNQIKNYRNNHLHNFKTSADDYLALAPAAIAFGLELTPYKSRTNIYDKAAIYAKSQLINFGVTTSLKHLIAQPRPDLSNSLSMPSGHTSLAFSNATFLALEYRKSIPWMPYAAYGVATSVGVLRIMNNKHYISDVLVGAAVGILSTRLAYWTHQYKWHSYLHRQRKMVLTKP